MWVITAWQAITFWNGVVLYCTTDTPTHLYAIWTLTEPSQVPRYKLNRGVWMFCGWEYVLHGSTSTEQNEPGNSTLHTFYLHPIPCSTTVWFILAEQPVSAPKIPTAGLFLYDTDRCDMPLPYIKAILSATQAIPHSTWTPIVFDATPYTSGTWLPGGLPSNELTVPETGVYIVNTHLIWAFNVIGRRGASVVDWPSDIHYAKDVRTAVGSVSLLQMEPGNQIRLTAGQTVRLKVWQNSGAPLNVRAENFLYTSLSLAKIPGTS